MRSNVSGDTQREYMIGEEVLMYRERPFGKWIGPYVIKDRELKLIMIETGDRLLRASVEKLKPYNDQDENCDGYIEEIIPVIDTTLQEDIGQKDYADYLLPSLEDEGTCSPEIQVDADTGERITIPGDDFDNEIFVGIHHTEVLEHGGPRARSEEFNYSKHNEVSGINRNTV